MKPDNWEKEFDEITVWDIDPSQVREFIRSLLARQRKSFLTMLPPEKEWPKGYPKEGEFCLADGYNLYRRELLNILK